MTHPDRRLRLSRPAGRTTPGRARRARSGHDPLASARARACAWGIEPVVADVLDPISLDALPASDRVLYCVGFDRSAGVPMRTVYVEGLRNVLGRLAGRTGRLVYASSTGVYGQERGAWVDEESETVPRHEAGRVCREAEQLARGSGVQMGLPVVVLRFSGLYGPGRILAPGQPLARASRSRATPRRFLNLIHIDDAAEATVAALDRGTPGTTYLVSDDRPVPRAGVSRAGRGTSWGTPSSVRPRPRRVDRGGAGGVEQADLEPPAAGRVRRRPEVPRRLLRRARRDPG